MTYVPKEVRVDLERMRAAKSEAEDTVLLPPSRNGKIYSEFPDHITICGSETSETLRNVEVSVPGFPKNEHFPLDCLPVTVANYVAESAAASNLDPETIAVPLLSILGGCIGSKRGLRLKARWDQSPTLWTCIVGETGCGKSPALALASRVLNRLQASKMEEWQQATEIYRAELDHWTSSSRKDRGEKPVQPIAERYLTCDTTLEGLARLLSENPRGLCLIRDELSGWFRSYDQYRSGRGSDLQHYLSIYDSSPITFDRKGGEKVVHVSRPSLSLTGTIQPSILNTLLSEANIENGLAGRFLFVLMEDRPRRWSDTDCDEITEDNLERLLRGLLDLAPDRDKEGRYVPMVRRFSREARTEWIFFHDEHDRERRNLKDPELKAAWAKLAAIPARIGLILHESRLIEDPESVTDPERVGVDTLRAAIRLTQWFGQQTRLLYDRVRSGGSTEAEKVYRIIQAYGGSMTSRELMNAYSKFKTSILLAEDALSDLAKRGLGKWGPFEVGPTGGRPSRRFFLEGCPEAKSSER